MAGCVIDLQAERQRMEARISSISHREMFSAARKMSAMKWRREPNWVFAMTLFGVGSTYAWEICRRMGVDPDSTKATPWPDETTKQETI